MAAVTLVGTETCATTCSSVSCSGKTGGQPAAGTIDSFLGVGATTQTPTYANCSGGSDTGPFNTCTASCQIVLDAVRFKKYSTAKLDPMADSVYNISDQGFSRAMCQALKVVTGSAGKTFAAFAIIATGIGFFTGKVSWGLMIGVTAGIATMFGAPSIVAAISGQDTTMSCDKIMPT